MRSLHDPVWRTWGKLNSGVREDGSREGFLSEMTIMSLGRKNWVEAVWPRFTAKSLHQLGLVIVVVMSLRTFSFFPGIRSLEELWFVVCIGGFLLVYPLLKIQADWTFSAIEVYLLVAAVVSIFLPAFTSHDVFGQPLGYGVLARRSVSLVFAWLLLIGAWRRRWVSAAQMERVLVSMAWFTFALYTAMRLLLNPLSFPGAPPGFVLGSGTTGATFAVPGCFMTFGVLYYALRGLREKRGLYYLFALVLLVNAVGPSGRFLTVSLVATIAFFLVRWRPFTQVLKTFVQFIVVAAVALAITYRINPEATAEKVGRYADAFQVVTGGESDDASANARVVESDIAYPYIRAHPYTGVGILSAQWEGAAGQIADYFFPDDIGFVGILFTYGSLGLLMFLFQYVFAIRAAFSVSARQSTPLLDATKAFVLYSAINSITTGLFVFSFEQSSFFIVLLFLLTADIRRSSPVTAGARGVGVLTAVAG